SLTAQTGFPTLMKVVEDDENGSDIRGRGEADGRQPSQVNRRSNAWNLARNLADPVDHLASSFERRGVWQLRHHRDITFVLLRNETRRHALEFKPGQSEQPEIHQDSRGAHANQTADRAAISS